MNINTILWIIQAILCIKFISTAFTHAFQRDKATMRFAIQKMGNPAKPFLSVVAVLMLIGAIGVILPAVFGSLAWLAPLAGAGLAIMNAIAILIHQKFREKPLPIADIVLFAMSAFVAYGRWVVAPL